MKRNQPQSCWHLHISCLQMKPVQTQIILYFSGKLIYPSLFYPKEREIERHLPNLNMHAKIRASCLNNTHPHPLCSQSHIGGKCRIGDTDILQVFSVSWPWAVLSWTSRAGYVSCRRLFSLASHRKWVTILHWAVMIARLIGIVALNCFG